MTEPSPCYCGSKSWERWAADGNRFVCCHCKRPLWQPIETTPEDDTDVLVVCENGFLWAANFYHGMWWVEQNDPEKITLTHWMPLPGLPS